MTPPRAPPRPAGVTRLTTHLLPDAPSNADKARALTRATPHLSSLHAHFGSRCSTGALAAFFLGLRGMERLRELRVTAWVPYAPQKGAWPLGCFAHLDLRGVTKLVVDGAAMAENEMLVRGPDACVRTSGRCWPGTLQSQGRSWRAAN
jgi:hypothetical protein